MNKEEINDDVQIAQEEQSDGSDYVEVQIPRTNKKYRIGKLKNNQLDALARLLMKNDGKDISKMDEILGDGKLACKAAAIYVTPGFFRLKLRYWYLWRWFYYVRQYDNTQLQPILSAGVGSTPYLDFLKTMAILSNQKTTQMRMTVKEAEAVMQEVAFRVEKAKAENGNVNTESED